MQYIALLNVQAIVHHAGMYFFYGVQVQRRPGCASLQVQAERTGPLPTGPAPSTNGPARMPARRQRWSHSADENSGGVDATK